MKDKLLLDTFEYSIVPSAVVTPQGEGASAFSVIQHLSLLSVRIDFKNGLFITEGDWKYMVASNKNAPQHWYSFYRGHVNVEAALFKSYLINLDDDSNDGIVFPFKGTIKDANSAGSCSDLLVINKDEKDKKLLGDKWSIILYFYDYQYDPCAIIFKLPVYTQTINADLN